MNEQETEKPARKVPAAVQIPIPPYAKPQTCKGPTCGRTVYWAEHPRTQKMHITSVNPTIDPACRAPTSTTWGVGISHYIDCPDRAEFARKKGGAPVPRDVGSAATPSHERER